MVDDIQSINVDPRGELLERNLKEVILELLPEVPEGFEFTGCPIPGFGEHFYTFLVEIRSSIPDNLKVGELDESLQERIQMIVERDGKISDGPGGFDFVIGSSVPDWTNPMIYDPKTVWYKLMSEGGIGGTQQLNETLRLGAMEKIISYLTSEAVGILSNDEVSNYIITIMQSGSEALPKDLELPREQMIRLSESIRNHFSEGLIEEVKKSTMPLARDLYSNYILRTIGKIQDLGMQI